MDNDDATKLAYSGLEAGEYPNMIGNARWDAVSARAQSLVLQLLQRDPAKRPSAQQVRPHPCARAVLCCGAGSRRGSPVVGSARVVSPAADVASVCNEVGRRCRWRCWAMPPAGRSACGAGAPSVAVTVGFPCVL